MKCAVCVCVPARNEADRLPVLLDALAAQTWRPLRVAICINNSDDDSAKLARVWGAARDDGLELEIVERDFAPGLAHAGSARGAAMDLGASRLEHDTDVLISTDADCRPPPDWVEAIMAAMDDERVVGGAIRLDDQESLDPSLQALRRRWDAYWAEVRAIEDDVDPRPWDPPPRHGDHTGASLAMTVGLYRRAGGVPLIEAGEDLALVDAAQAVGGKLVHPPSVWTRASARVAGRAAGGMAAEMRRLATCAATGTAPLAPDFAHWRARANWRSEARLALSAAELLEQERRLAPMPCDMPLPEIE